MSDKIDLGRKAEALVEAQVRQSGWNYIADVQFAEGEAAMIRGGGDNGRIRPDFSVAKNGECVWVEVKGKKEVAEYNGTERHGINLYNWQEYNRVANLTGNPCWLFVYEKSSGLLLCRDLEELPVANKRIKDNYAGDDPYGNDMVFFNKSDFNVKKIAKSTYPESFFGQDKLPLENIAEEKKLPLFPNSELGECPDTPNQQLGDFATDGGVHGSGSQ
jgi:hypothetical protein